MQQNLKSIAHVTRGENNSISKMQTFDTSSSKKQDNSYWIGKNLFFLKNFFKAKNLQITTDNVIDYSFNECLKFTDKKWFILPLTSAYT